MRIFSLGTGGRHPLDFSRILAKYGIEVIFDIRRLPLREIGFDREALQRICTDAGVSYVFLGNELGADLNYRTWTASEPVTRWLGVIGRKLEQRAVCLLCREFSPVQCRRRALTEKLARADLETVHIIDDRRVWHRPPDDPGLLAPRPVRPQPPGRKPFGSRHPSARPDHRGGRRRNDRRH